jgi:predicted naringenin-chalcone synthase
MRKEGLTLEFKRAKVKIPESFLIPFPKKLLEKFETDKDSIDCFKFHRVNMFMNEQICKKLKLEKEKVPYSLKYFGNTSSAFISAYADNGMGRKTEKLAAVSALGFCGEAWHLKPIKFRSVSWWKYKNILLYKKRWTFAFHALCFNKK